MPTETDLVGLGVPAQLADALGNQDNTLTCTGTTQAAGATVKTTNTALVTSGGATAATLPSSAMIGSPYFFFNTTATAALVFCPSGDVLNGTSNGSLSIAQNKGAIIWQYKKDNWVSVLTA